jgi:hypothetical protein
MVRKRRAAISALDVDIEGFQASDPPWQYERVVLHFRVVAERISEGMLERVVRLSIVRYCSVLATLRGVARVEATIELVDPTGVSSGQRSVPLDPLVAGALAEVAEPAADDPAADEPAADEE